MRELKVIKYLAIFLLSFGILCWWRALDQREFWGEDKTNNQEIADLESRLNRKLKEIEKKVDYKFKEELIEWSKSLVKKGSKTFSQNDEDGVIEAVFEFIRTTDKVYVEFGVESCVECNSRYLR